MSTVPEKVIRLSDLIAYTNDQIAISQEEKAEARNPSEKSYNSGEIMALRRLRSWAEEEAGLAESTEEKIK